MKTKILGKLNPNEDIQEQFLTLRGLSKEWVQAGEEHFHDGRTLRHYNEAAALIEKHIRNGSKIAILTDGDFDGLSSASIMYQWLLDKNSNLQLIPIVPEGKTHGIVHTNMIPECDLLITPDASSSEGEKHKILMDKGVDILVLDHHEFLNYDSKAVIINPHHKDCPYPNKNLSGAGVVYKFTEAYDKERNSEDYKKYIDLAAASIVADVMSLRSMENKAIVNIGLANIHNGFFRAFLDYDRRVQGKPVSPIIVGFYFAPIINAVIRVGTVEDKQQIFRALVGEASPQAVIASSISLKGKQDRNKESVIPRIVMGLQKSQRDQNKIVFAEAPNTLNKSSSGLVAGNLAGMYQKPTFLMRERDGKYVGSARSLNGTNVENFKDFCEGSGLFEFVAGHQAAFGGSITKENLEKFIEYANENLPKVEKHFTVDFDIANLSPADKANAIEQLFALDSHIGNDITPILLHDEIDIAPEDIQLIGKNNNTLKIYKNGIVYIKFKAKNYELPTTMKTYRIVGKPNMNEWNGDTTPQLFIEELEEKELAL